MPADKLGRYMMSSEFLERANAAITKAVRDLESRNIQPAYRDRKTGQIVGSGEGALREVGSCEGRGIPDILNQKANPTGAKDER
ncbi:hypothetical protein NFI99_15100 [Burkholderia glumae]|uniref:Uncharacterized protein n=1 Tax=Burkholderia glumae TaxID=337 RepID=A0ABY5BKA3_BURGL|nr:MULTISPECIES: hypothetical protein [Burkholderia]USS46257.1 hypothetical protein NFI99_15100 [Burkholderia glumae]